MKDGGILTTRQARWSLRGSIAHNNRVDAATSDDLGNITKMGLVQIRSYFEHQSRFSGCDVDWSEFISGFSHSVEQLFQEILVFANH